MNFDELILKRESCRAYTGEKVYKEDLAFVVNAGRMSPSARNSQPWDFYIVSGDKLDDAKRAVQFYGTNAFTDKAGAFIVAVKEDADLPVRPNMPVRNFEDCDIGMAVVSMAYQAADMGLGTCILGMFNENMLKEIVGIPNDKRTVKLVLAVGIPEDIPVRTKTRKGTYAVAHFVD